MKATLQDVADRANVSVTTASFTLRNHSKAQTFNPETVARIQAAAAELNYKPNFFAMQSQRDHSQIAMVCVPNLQDPYAGAIAEHFQRRGVERDYWTLIQTLPEKESQRSMLDERIIGDHGISSVALVSSTADEVKKKVAKRAIENGVTLITIGREPVLAGTCCVQIDDYYGGTLIGKHILERGFKRIAYAHSGHSNKSRASRFEGVCESLKKGGVEIAHEFTVDVSDINSPQAIIETSIKATEQAIFSLSEKQMPEVIVAAFDLIAIGINSALASHGLVAGKDIDIIGYDDIWMAQTMQPPLTTVHQPVKQLGRTAADLLFDIIEGKETKPRTVIIKPEMVFRQSSPATAAAGA